MDHDVLDRLLSDELQKALQFRAVGSLGRLAANRELFDHGRLEAGSLAFARFPLSRDGVALHLAASLGLLLARHPQIDHGGSTFRSISPIFYPPVIYCLLSSPCHSACVMVLLTLPQPML